MAATSYTMNLKNSTDKAYHFGIYQDFPNSPGLRSVVWQVRGLGPGATSSVDWKAQYGVAIADWDRDGTKYTGQQIVNAELGRAYEVNLVDGDIPVINPNPLPKSVAPTADDQIKLHNNTNRPLSLGFTVDGKLLAIADTVGNEWTNYIIHSSYYVALYRCVEHGRLVDSGVELGPWEITYDRGYKTALFESIMDNGQYTSQTPQFIPG